MYKVIASGLHGSELDCEEEGETGPDLAYFPAGQIAGDTWVLGVLRDLMHYSEFRDMAEMTEALRDAHRIAERLILH